MFNNRNTDNSGRRLGHLRKPAALVGAVGLLFSVAVVASPTALADPSFPAGTAISVAAANNAYAAMQQLGPQWATARSAAAFTSDAAAQAGGCWRTGDSTTLRGITSGTFKTQVTTSTVTSGCETGPLTDVNVFLSADKTNANAVIPTASGGTCTATCPGVASTETKYATGALVIYSCNGSWVTGTFGAASPGFTSGSGNGVPGSPACNATPLPQADPTSFSQLINWLENTAGAKLSIALPSAAPYGQAAMTALTQAGFPYDDNTNNASQNAFPAGTGTNQCEGTLPTGATCKVRLEAGITQVRGAVTAGLAQAGLAALSSVQKVTWTSGTNTGSSLSATTPSPDPNLTATGTPKRVVALPAADYSNYNSGNGIQQWGVALNVGTTNQLHAAENFLDWLTEATAQAALATFGYTP